MASTTSNMDLVPKQALDELKLLDTQLKTTTKNLEALLVPVQEISKELSKSTSNYKTLTDTINKLNGVEKEYNRTAAEHNRVKKEIERLHVRLAQAQSNEAKEVAALKEQIRQQNLETRNSAKEMMAASGSVDMLRAKLNLLTQQYNQLSEEVRNSDFGQALKKQAADTNATLVELESGVGNFSRNVGNYASGFSPLGFQVQQIARELPSLTMSLSQFFLAISNNVPMLVDEVQRATAANKALKDEGKQGVPVWKQMISSILSWQTALVIGITLVTAYGKEIGEFVKGLFGAGSAAKFAAKMNEEYNNTVMAGRKSGAEEAAKLKVLYDATQNHSRSINEKKQAAIELQKTYPKTFSNFSVEEILLGKAVSGYEMLSKNIIASAVAKAKFDKISELASRRLDIESQLEHAKEIEEISRRMANEAANNPYAESPGLFLGHSSNVNDVKELAKQLGTIDQEMTKLASGINITDLVFDRNESVDTNVVDKKIKDSLHALTQSQLEARQELAVGMMEASAEENKAIVENDKSLHAERLIALDAYAQKQAAAVHASASNQIENLVQQKAEELGIDISNIDNRIEVEKLLSDEIGLIRWKASEEAMKIDKYRAEASVEIEKDRVNKVIQEISREATARGKEIDMKESRGLADLAKEYAQGKMKPEEYQARKTGIGRDAEKERFNAEAGMLEAQLQAVLNSPDSTLDDSLAIFQKIEDAKLEYEQYINSESIKNDEETAKKKEEIEKQLSEKKKELLQAVFDLGSQLMEQHFEAQLDDLERQSEENEEWSEGEKERIDQLEESGAISKEQADARKAAVDEQAAAREAELEEKKKKVQRKQAIYEKAMTIAQIGWNTAAAIIGLWAKPGFPAAIPLAAMVGALGAVQIATVLATPIPEYALGTKDHPGGLALVGDGGRSEMIMTPGGSLFTTPDTDTLVDLPAHSVVMPDFNKAVDSLMFEKLPQKADRRSDTEITFKEMVEVTKAGNKKVDAFLSSFNRYKGNQRYNEIVNSSFNPKNKIS